AASKIALTGSTGSLASGTGRLLTATVQDAAGNTVTSGADSFVSVNFAQTGGTGSVSGTGSSAASGGVATKTVTGNLAGGVTLTGNRAGPVSIQASGTLNSSPVTSSSTLTFTVVHGTATKIVLSGTTTDLPSSTTRQLTATIEDAAGNTVNDGADATDSITF